MTGVEVELHAKAKAGAKKTAKVGAKKTAKASAKVAKKKTKAR